MEMSFESIEFELSQGQFEKALHEANRELSRKPDSPKVRNLMCIAYAALGNFEAAEKECRTAIKLNPKYAEGYYNLGNVLKDIGRAKAAISHYQTAVSLKPDFFLAHYNMALAYIHLAEFEDAEESFLRTLEIEPNYYPARINVASILRDRGQFDKAVEHCQIVLKADAMQSTANLMLASIAELKNDIPQACSYYKIALIGNPTDTNTHNNLAVCLKSLGEYKYARRHFRIALQIEPKNTGVHLNLSNLTKYTLKNKHLKEMNLLSKDTTLNKSQICQLRFALGKAYADLEIYETAFQNYQIANKFRKEQIGYTIEKDLSFFKKIKEITPVLLRNSIFQAEKSSSTTPIFILGMPRSGTTLVEQILTRHSSLSGGGELPFVEGFGEILINGKIEINQANLNTFRKQYLARANILAYGKSYLTDKMPSNFRFISLILSVFPDALIINVQRRKNAVCWSNFKTYFPTTGLGFTCDLNDVSSYYDLYLDLMNFWPKQIKDKIVNIDYDSLVYNPTLEIRKMLDKLGLPWEIQCLQPEKNVRSVMTASSTQVKQAIYTGSSEEYRRYISWLPRQYAS